MTALSQLVPRDARVGRQRVLVVGLEPASLGLAAEARVDRCGVDELSGGDAPRYELVAVGDVLYPLTATAVEQALAGIRRRLRPGGACLIDTRTYLHSDGAGLADRLQTPYAHLAFARDVLEEYYAVNDWPVPRLGNYMCRATYFVLFRRAGYSIEATSFGEADPDVFADKLRPYDASEARTAAFRVLLRPTDDDHELEQLRRIRIAS